MRSILPVSIGTVLSFASAAVLAAPPADGDFAKWGFLNGGQIRVPFDVLGSTLSDGAADSFVDADGSMFIAGTVSTPEGSRFGIVKLLPTGGLANGEGGTSAFSGDGRNVSEEMEASITANAVALNGDYILVAGTEAISNSENNFIVCRFHATNGNSVAFPNNGNSSCVRPQFLSGTLDRASDIVVQPDGKFVVAGTVDAGPQSRAGFARFNADGTPDLDFGNVQGSNMSLVRNENIFDRHTIHAVALASNGKIVGVGETVNVGDTIRQALVIRLNPDGTLEQPEFVFDSSTVPAGYTVLTDVVAVDDPASADDALVVVGYAEVSGNKSGGLIGKVNSTGNILAVGTFGNNAGTTVTALGAGSLVYESVAAQSGGNFITLGQRPGVGDDALDIEVRRFSYRGVLDSSFGSGGSVIYDGLTPGEIDTPAAVSVFRDGVYFSGSVAMAGDNIDFVASKLTLDRIFSDGLE